MKPVIQQEKTGCAIASSAALANLSYAETKVIANQLGIFAEDESLWSDSTSIRNLLHELSIPLASKETPFTHWESLPKCALLALKWHKKKGKPFWHWALFIREDSQAFVLDSNSKLKSPIRTDFGRMKPKWFITVYLTE